ncbi:hypothetical protein PSEUBRA_001863 [Kalmanozyma brasiliensis GHG001]|uniref:Uncharacterized protein n=1 Tax=Kalmanozyma brasiliensis (strain GHG001) TaxID=1365824 RepID=V5EXW3_KALBG|nr:uncharacterized protein PSEUBRA_001863 [Kalmanozyma brasiliensis GHG001]EST08448.1 hypothetical protein PSEUBRA_001863 [Kalmanozyma brasiliensis GHG001]
MSTPSEESQCFDRAGITVLTVPYGQRCYIDDGRTSLAQFIDKLRDYKNDPRTRIETAHYERGMPTIIVTDLEEASRISPSLSSVKHANSITTSRGEQVVDVAGVYVFNMARTSGQQSDQNDGREVLEQYIDMLRDYGNNSDVELESAHYENDTATFFISDPTDVEVEYPYLGAREVAQKNEDPVEQVFDPSKRCEKIHYFESREATPLRHRQGFFDDNNIYIFNEGKRKGYETVKSDGRMLVDQYVDLLRKFLSDPNVSLEGAHYRPGHNDATFFIGDPSASNKKKADRYEQTETVLNASKPGYNDGTQDDVTK